MLQLILGPVELKVGHVAGRSGSVFSQKNISNELSWKGKKHSPWSFDVSTNKNPMK